MPLTGNIFAGIPAASCEECFATLLEGRWGRIERIASFGQASPPGFWYDQPHDEWVLVLRGRARLRVEEEMLELEPGSYVHLAAHVRHRVEWTSQDEPTLWLAIHFPAEDS
ncbi:MAG: cupin domain-containing protein [Pirellulales bacterium]|nr:cupin domain-containing protein [Pirellulales bacterium]